MIPEGASEHTSTLKRKNILAQRHSLSYIHCTSGIVGEKQKCLEKHTELSADPVCVGDDIPRTGSLSKLGREQATIFQIMDINVETLRTSMCLRV